MLLADPKLEGMASAAVRAAMPAPLPSSPGGDPKAFGDDSQLAIISEQLVKERIVSAALQSKLDELGEQYSDRMSADRAAYRQQLASRAAQLDATLRVEAEGAKRRCQLLTAQMARHKAEASTLRALNAQLLNAADPLVLASARIDWPKDPELHPASDANASPAYAQLSPRPPQSSRPSSARGSADRHAKAPSRPQSARSAAPERPPAKFGSQFPRDSSPPMQPQQKRQASSGLTHARVVQRRPPYLFDTLETVVLRRQEFEEARREGEAAGLEPVPLRPPASESPDKMELPLYPSLVDNSIVTSVRSEVRGEDEPEVSQSLDELAQP